MLYQKLLMGKNPYVVAVGPANPFQPHCHPEIELSYCLEGQYPVLLEGRELLLTEGDLLVINPMVPHEFPKNSGEGYRLTIELGPGLLGDFFDHFSRLNPESGILRLKEGDSFRPLIRLLEETAQLRRTPTEFSNLLLRGNLYRLSGILLALLARERPAGSIRRDAVKIENALDIIYNHYHEPLELEAVAQKCGYSKSGFCRVFKSVTGDTFHSILNRHRVEIACLRLKTGGEPVERIAAEVGFADAKSFCRVFKAQIGQSPGAYRKQFETQKQFD